MPDLKSLNLTRAQRRRLIGFGLLRAFIAAAGLILLYFLIPLEWIDNVPIGLAVILAAIVLVGVSTWQVLAIIRSNEPGVRAIESLATIAPLYLLLFAATYFMMARDDPAAFTQALSRMDALYFTVTVFATVGFGDIAAVSQTARLFVTIQMVLNLILLGAGLRLLTVAVKYGREDKPGKQAAAPEPAVHPGTSGVHPGANG